MDISDRTPRSADDALRVRTRALERLRRLTFGAPLAGSLATLGFGGVAALDQAGRPVTAEPTTAGGSSSTAAGATGTSSSAASRPSAASASPSPSATLAPAASTPSTATSGSAQVSTGGSG